MSTVFLFLLIASLPLGQMIHYSPLPGVNLYPQDLAVAVLWLGAVITLLRKRPKLSPPRLLRPLTWFLGIALVSLLLATRYAPFAQTAIGSLYLWRFLAYCGVYLILTQPSLGLSALGGRAVKRIPEWLTAAGFATAVAGLVQYFLLPDTRFLFARFWDEHYYRLIGPWLDPNFTGLMLVLTLLSSFAIKNVRPLYLYVLRATCFIALLLTYSRSSYVAFLIGLGVLAWLKQKPKLFLFGLGLLAGGVLVLPRPGGEGVRLERSQSIVDRLQNYQETLTIAKDHPILGVGFNLLRYERERRGLLGEDWERNHAAAGADSSFLFVLATTGIVGLTAYLFLLKDMLILGLRKKNAALSASLLAVSAHALFNNSLFFPAVMLWLWLLATKTEATGSRSR